MDEVFWATVLKRWSEASENVIQLKNELAKARAERTRHDQTFLRHHAELPFVFPERTNVGGQHAAYASATSAGEGQEASKPDELKDAEVGFGRAKEEYRRLQQELNISAQRIQALSQENVSLTANQQELTKLRHENEDIRRLQKELDILQSNNRSLHDKIKLLEQSSLRGQSNAPSITPCADSRLLSSLKQQVEALQLSIRPLEIDNSAIRQELETTKGKLQKAEEDKKRLLESILKLQGITRHSALHPISTNILSSRSDRSSRAVSFVSSHRPQIEKPHQIVTLKNTLAGPAGDITFVDDPTPFTIPFPEPGFSDARQKIIATFPSVVPDTEADLSNNSFDREFLKITLGCDAKTLVDRLSLNSDLPPKRSGNTSYLCPTLNHHPWCPSMPGQHGYIFVGLGKERESYKSPTIRNLFVGLPKPTKNHRQFRYLGRYRVVRVDPLSREEWSRLPPDVKSMYAKHTKEKTKDPRSYEDVMQAYDMGNFLVPCVQLQCLSFDREFYLALLEQRDTR